MGGRFRSRDQRHAQCGSNLGGNLPHIILLKTKKKKKFFRGRISKTSSESSGLLGIPATFLFKFPRSFFLMVRALNLDWGTLILDGTLQLRTECKSVLKNYVFIHRN